MTTITEKQADMKSVWAISSILEGVRQCHDEWAIFAPRCEPFWPSLSSIEGVMRVQTAARGITLACESQKPAVVFVPNRQLTICKSFTYKKSMLAAGAAWIAGRAHNCARSGAPVLSSRRCGLVAG